MDEIKIFENPEFGMVRTVEVNGEAYFVGKDIAEILGYSRPDHAIANHVDDEDKLMYQIDTSGQNRTMFIINESGVYSLILSSKLPKAREFKHWVTSEVLPTIRKHGAYLTEDALHRAITEPDFLIKLATELKEEKTRRRQLEVEAEENKPKVLFADAVETSQSSILIGDLAKLLKQNGVEIGQKRLFEELRERGYLIKYGNSRNMPTQRAMELGLFEVKERVISNPDGSVRITRTTKVSGKGQTYFINKFLGKK